MKFIRTNKFGKFEVKKVKNKGAEWAKMSFVSRSLHAPLKLLIFRRYIQTAQLMKLSFLLWLMRRSFFQRATRIAHIGRTTFHFCRSSGSHIASVPAQKQQTSAIFLTQAYQANSACSWQQSVKFTNTFLCSEESGEAIEVWFTTCRNVQLHTNTHMHMVLAGVRFQKQNSQFWGKVTRSGDRKQRFFRLGLKIYMWERPTVDSRIVSAYWASLYVRKTLKKPVCPFEFLVGVRQKL